MLKKRLYFSLGWLSLFAGVVGIFLPLLPTTPFVLLSAFCFSRSSPRFYGWLTANPYLNSYIENHRSGCGVPAKIVWRALAFLWAGLLLSAYCLKNPWFWLFFVFGRDFCFGAFASAASGGPGSFAFHLARAAGVDGHHCGARLFAAAGFATCP